MLIYVSLDAPKLNNAQKEGMWLCSILHSRPNRPKAGLGLVFAMMMMMTMIMMVTMMIMMMMMRMKMMMMGQA